MLPLHLKILNCPVSYITALTTTLLLLTWLSTHDVTAPPHPDPAFIQTYRCISHPSQLLFRV